ncbi:heat-inducible transcriptional repressor HrcA [Dehalogenimonas sp. 4OHTPN]|uniref:Heat-inducible transcription repressor HrcA n=1 Tax=Dehalogenimonas sp. 4OHTPN TaxID=3166643 RepID=A0AAU8GAG3_9CHLR
MLNSRSETILSSIIRQYIERAVPVSSAAVISECGLDVCSATVRNEMVRLEEEGYILKPHHSAGSVPSDKGYRYYVESIKHAQMSLTDQLLINHLFHQVEKEMENWLSLAAGLVSQRVHNVAVVTQPKQTASKYHHLELVTLQENLALAVLILRGARVRQQLVSFGNAVGQFELTATSQRLNQAFDGLTRTQVEKSNVLLSDTEKKVHSAVLKMMQAEDEQRNEEPYLDGLNYLLEQPEFARSQRAHSLMELVEKRQLGRMLGEEEFEAHEIKVYIGQENREQSIRDFSVVLGSYGLPNEARGTLGVIGPTRMNYEKTIAAVRYLSLVMSALVAELYGREPEPGSGG